MLGDSDVVPTLPVKDIEAAKKFYEQTLGLKKLKEDQGGVVYESGQSKLFIYESENGGTNKGTSAGWRVGDVEATVESLRKKGLTFEQYDNLPGATRDGDIHTWGPYKAAWFKDPSGNILALDNQ